jgi:hypothetical protein
MNSFQTSRVVRTVRTAFGRRLREAAMVLACLVVVMTPARTLAQTASEWTYGGYDAMAHSHGYLRGLYPRFTRAMLNQAAQRLGLDNDQRETASSLYDAFEREYQSMWLIYTERTADNQSRFVGPEEWAEVEQRQQQQAREYADKAEALVKDFLVDLELILRPEQLTVWEAIERDRVRNNNLALAAGDDLIPIDLSIVVASLTLEASVKESLRPLLSAYHDDVDAALAAALRTATRVQQLAQEINSINSKMSSLYMQPDGFSEEDAQRLQEASQALEPRLVTAALELDRQYTAVRAAHARHMARIREELPSSQRELFDRATTKPNPDHESRFGLYSRFNSMARALEQVETTRMMFEFQLSLNESDWMSEEEQAGIVEMARLARRVRPLSPEQRARIEQIREEYQRRAKELKDSYYNKVGVNRKEVERDSIALRLPEGTVRLYRQVDRPTMSWSQDPGDVARMEMYRKHAVIDQAAIDQLREILDFHQRALIAMF